MPAQPEAPEVLIATSYSTCGDESGPNTMRLAFWAQEAPSEVVIMKRGRGPDQNFPKREEARRIANGSFG